MNQEITLLYVDDEPLNLTLFEINFRRKYKVLTAGSGAEGLQKLEGNQDIIVVISDMKMPGMNGIEFIKKAKEQYNHIAYFILTAFDINKEIKEALDQKLINRYFNKPFNIKEIDGAIQEFLRSL
ncbi:MAG: response regulator [Salinivirgaceae bacterium]